MERVVLNALALDTALLPDFVMNTGDIESGTASSAIFLTSVRAGLAFSGEVDPPQELQLCFNRLLNVDNLNDRPVLRFAMRREMPRNL